MQTDSIFHERLHQEKMDVLARIEKGVRNLLETRPPIDAPITMISATVPYLIDYKNRRYVYMWSSTTFTASIGVLGSINVVGGSWTCFNFPAGTQVLAPNSTANIPVFILNTDDIIYQGSAGSSSPSSITATPNPANPTSTGIGIDTTFTWGATGTQQINTLYIQNKTVTPVWYAFNAAASHGSYQLMPGGLQVWQRPFTTLHLFTDAAQPINGTSVNNIVVEGGE